jgi:hypothetical protein
VYTSIYLLFGKDIGQSLKNFAENSAKIYCSEAEQQTQIENDKIPFQSLCIEEISPEISSYFPTWWTPKKFVDPREQTKMRAAERENNFNMNKNNISSGSKNRIVEENKNLQFLELENAEKFLLFVSDVDEIPVGLFILRLLLKKQFKLEIKLHNNNNNNNKLNKYELFSGNKKIFSGAENYVNIAKYLVRKFRENSLYENRADLAQVFELDTLLDVVKNFQENSKKILEYLQVKAQLGLKKGNYLAGNQITLPGFFFFFFISKN